MSQKNPSNRRIQTFITLALTSSLLSSFSAQAAALAEVDSGFDPAKYGFAFENYGGDEGYKNLTPVEMVRLYGNGVCEGSDSSNCVLSPVAEQWMTSTNTSMNGGHCEGMAVLSALFYTHKVETSTFGASTVHDLKIAGNEALQHEIAFWWATQATSPASDAVIKDTPSQIVARLSDVLKAGKDAPATYSIGIYKRDGSGGHAVTPYAITHKGGDVWDIMVYDNNYPSQPRVIEVNSASDTWSYSASINPGVPEAVYEGDASTKTLDLTPSTLRMALQDCPFCTHPTTNTTNTTSTKGSSTPTTKVAHFTEIFLAGSGAHLMITDDKGRRLARVGNTLINEIPGAKVVAVKSSVTQWSFDQDPIFQIPEGIKFTVTLDGSSLKKEVMAEIAMIGTGHSLDIKDIKLKPAQKDTLTIAADGVHLSYKPGQGESPQIVLAVEGKGMDHKFMIKGFDLEQGGAVNVGLDVVKGQLQLNTLGNKKTGNYDLAVVCYDSKGTQAFGDTFKLEPSDTVYADYLKWTGNGNPMTLELDYKSDGSIDKTVELADLQK